MRGDTKFTSIAHTHRIDRENEREREDASGLDRTHDGHFQTDAVVMVDFISISSFSIQLEKGRGL